MSDKPKSIAIETTSRRGGLAIGEGEQLLTSASFAADRDHASQLFPAAADLCNQVGWSPRQIEHVYVSIGPGSFTGTRIGVTFGKSLAFGSGAQVVAVPTFQALALNTLSLSEPPATLVVLIDARQGQVFAETFALSAERNGYQSVQHGRLVYLTDLIANLQGSVAFLGEGVAVHREALAATGQVLLPDEVSFPQAESVYRIGWQMAQAGQFSPADGVVPVYYRLPTPVEKLAGSR